MIWNQLIVDVPILTASEPHGKVRDPRLYGAKCNKHPGLTSIPLSPIFLIYGKWCSLKKLGQSLGRNSSAPCWYDQNLLSSVRNWGREVYFPGQTFTHWWTQFSPKRLWCVPLSQLETLLAVESFHQPAGQSRSYVVGYNSSCHLDYAKRASSMASLCMSYVLFAGKLTLRSFRQRIQVVVIGKRLRPTSLGYLPWLATTMCYFLTVPIDWHEPSASSLYRCFLDIAFPSRLLTTVTDLMSELLKNFPANASHEYAPFPNTLFRCHCSLCSTNRLASIW